MIPSGAPNTGRAWAAMPLSGLILTPVRVFEASGRTFASFAPSDAYAGSLAAVPVVGMGGGPSRFAHFARETPDPTTGNGRPQMAVLFLGRHSERRPFACFDVEEAGLLDGAAAEHTAGGGRSTAFGVTDTAIGNGGSRVILGEGGDVTTDTTGATDPTVRVQLPAAGKFRVSRAGAASGRLLLKTPTVSYLSDLRTQLQIMSAAIYALQQDVFGPDPTRTPTSIPDPASRALASAAILVSSDAE